MSPAREMKTRPTTPTRWTTDLGWLGGCGSAKRLIRGEGRAGSNPARGRLL